MTGLESLFALAYALRISSSSDGFFEQIIVSRFRFGISTQIYLLWFASKSCLICCVHCFWVEITFGCSRFVIKNFGRKLFSVLIIQALYPSILVPFFLPFTAWVLWRTSGHICVDLVLLGFEQAVCIMSITVCPAGHLRFYPRLPGSVAQHSYQHFPLHWHILHPLTFALVRLPMGPVLGLVGVCILLLF